MKKYDITAFKSNNNIVDGKSLYAFLINLGIDPSFIKQNSYDNASLDDDKKVDVNSLFYDYFNEQSENREISIMENDGEIALHVGTNGTKNGSDDATACLLVARPNELVMSEVYYERIGNGVNQGGTTITKVLNKNEDKINSTDMRATLGFINDSTANLIYYEESVDLFEKIIDGINLDFTTDNPELARKISLSLEMFRKVYLKGINRLIGLSDEWFYEESEDLEFIAKSHDATSKMKSLNRL